MKVLVLGATGYVGSRLVPSLIQSGHDVRCLVRDRSRADGLIAAGAEVVTGDLLKPETLRPAFDGVSAAYYLVHSMASSGSQFHDLDITAARNAAKAAAIAGLDRVIYLGGLGRRSDNMSPHLRSRHLVGDTLREGEVPVTEFRAAVIVGAGSISFRMIRHLVTRLPFMICPRWVQMKTQPIGIDDVLRYLQAGLTISSVDNDVFDIGGPDVLTYREMMVRVASILNKRRLIVQVPVLTPRLSSYWVNLVTPVKASVARSLIESVRHETVCEDSRAAVLFDIKPESFDTAVKRALRLDPQASGSSSPVVG